MIKEIEQDYCKLSRRSEEIYDLRKENELVRSTILDLKETITAKDLNALTAPQLGVYKRIVVLKFGKNDLRTFINPIISECKGYVWSREKCPSVDNGMSEYIRLRSGEVTVMFTTPLGKPQATKLNGLAAIVMQEAIDHLEGVLLNDIGLHIDSDWDTATDEEREEVIKAYCDSLDIKYKDVQAEIEQDDSLKETVKAIEFMESVQKGETKIKVEPITIKKATEEQ